LLQEGGHGTSNTATTPTVIDRAVWSIVE
jgi:hypothetical protein